MSRTMALEHSYNTQWIAGHGAAAQHAPRRCWVSFRRRNAKLEAKALGVAHQHGVAPANAVGYSRRRI